MDVPASWGEMQMTKIIRCECGYVVNGSTDAELLDNAFAHIRDAHPAMKDAVTGEALLGMAEVVA
jgi:hypothetical protein